MGLDMYLEKRTYVKNWDHQPPERRHEITVKLGGEPRSTIKPERISNIIEEVAYWRKANAIHKWFVDNVQDGVDDCREYPVDHDKLRDLINTCKQVLGCTEMLDGEVPTSTTYYPDGRVVAHVKPGEVAANPAVAERLLPSQAGFFFGGTEYNEYYVDDLKRTIEMLEPLLLETDGEFYYTASW